MPNPPPFDRPIAHRGLHDRTAGVIENSSSAFERAIAGRFAIECDLQLSRDGVPVVFHDDDLERLTGRVGPVASLSAAELTRLPLLGSTAGDCPQRFADLLAQVAGRTLLQVELKRQPTPATTATLARVAADAAATYNGPLVYESFDPRLLVALHRAGYRGALGIITYRYDRPNENTGISSAGKFMLRHLLHYPATRFDFLSVQAEALTLPAVQFFKRLGKQVTSWTIRSVEASRAARAAGADQIVFEGFDGDRG